MRTEKGQSRCGDGDGSGALWARTRVGRVVSADMGQEQRGVEGEGKERQKRSGEKRGDRKGVVANIGR